jgi:hypothetical protein
MSLVYRLLTAGLSLFMLLMLGAGCVTNGTNPITGGGGSNPTVLAINGRQIKADELIKSPAFKQAFQQFAYGEVIRQRAAKEGLKPDAAEIDKTMSEQKDRIIKMGMKWEDMLKQQGMTEAEVRQMMEMQDLHKQLMKKLAGNVTEDEVKDAWEKRKAEFLPNYAAQKSLTEAQKKEAEQKGLAMPELKDFVKEQLAQENEQKSGQQMIMKMLREMKVELPALGDPKTEEEYANLIFKANLPPDEEEEKKKAEEAKAAEAGKVEGEVQTGEAEGTPSESEEGEGAPPATAAPPVTPPATPPSAPPAGDGK